MTIEIIDKWITSVRFNEIQNGEQKRFYFFLNWFLIDFIFCSLGFSISHVTFSEVTFSEVTSVWGVSAVAILDCSLNVYACGRQGP